MSPTTFYSGCEVKPDAHETPINAINREDINALLVDVYKVNYDRLPAPNNKIRPTGNTVLPVYK